MACVLMTAASYRKLLKELKAWRSEAVENNPSRVGMRNALAAQSALRANATLRRAKAAQKGKR